jgi:hypothetical protein
MAARLLKRNRHAQQPSTPEDRLQPGPPRTLSLQWARRGSAERRQEQVSRCPAFRCRDGRGRLVRRDPGGSSLQQRQSPQPSGSRAGRGPLLLPEHVQNLPMVGTTAPGPVQNDPGVLREFVGGLAWQTKVKGGFRGSPIGLISIGWFHRGFRESRDRENDSLSLSLRASLPAGRAAEEVALPRAPERSDGPEARPLRGHRAAQNGD